MFTIYKISCSPVIDYAAEELKKYLRMMMPECGNITIDYNKDAKDGFLLGLMSDFGLDTSDVKDTKLDDIIYFDCDECGGVIAGDNPRSVLLSVYEYLRSQGCRWIMPGVDGELIPMQNIKAAKLRHTPSMRYRGWATEGTVRQEALVDFIEFLPKLGMNVFMTEFKFPKSFYERYYEHKTNPYRTPEPVNYPTMMQWKRHLECEIEKCGLQFHDMGHGFSYEPLGIACEDGWNLDYDKELTPEQRELIALINGKREIQYCPFNTNLCMSNPKARELVVKYVVDYPKHHSNVDYLHVWLADPNNNHCECEECVKLHPTDFYVEMLNEIDEALTQAKLDTKIVFIAYMDTAWAPLERTIKNQDRFLLMLAPITRRYDITLSPEKIPDTIPPYVRNKLVMPRSLEEFYALFNDWRREWHGSNFSFEYHFWRAMYNDVTGLRLAELLHKDVRAYSENGIDGMLENGTQRCFFPNGIEIYSYARSMFNKETPFEDIVEDYFSVAYGDEWKKVYDYLNELDLAFDYQYMVRRKSVNEKVSPLYNPDHAKSLEKVPEICQRASEVIASLEGRDYRVRSVSLRILRYHLIYAKLLSDAYVSKACGRDDEALEKYKELLSTMAKYEMDIEPYYDLHLTENALAVVFVRTVTHNDYMDVPADN